MAQLKLQDLIIALANLPARPKSLDEEAQDGVFGGFWGPMQKRRQSLLRQKLRRPGAQMGWGRKPKPRRRVPVYAMRRVLVGYRFI